MQYIGKLRTSFSGIDLVYLSATEICSFNSMVFSVVMDAAINLIACYLFIVT